MKPSRFILPVIVFSQFCCTSLWFAGNAVLNDLVQSFNLSSTIIGYLTSSVQFGFIVGTLCFAILTLADRFSPSKVFFVSALLGAVFNLGLVWDGNSLGSILTFRFFTGFFLAGIYPVGMKIAADYYEKGLGKSLGFLVGALVLGTAFPHLLKDMIHSFNWKFVILLISCFAIFGGVLMVFLVPDGPYRKPGLKFNSSAFFEVFKNRQFRSSAFGYFGHMWELYTFWAFVPLLLKSYTVLHPQVSLNIPLFSFLIIGIGGIACVLGGYISQLIGVKRAASIALLGSCVCCLLCPFVFALNHEILFLGFMFLWGALVIADSPLFSTLVAHNASPEIKGTALTIVNCIGFSITIVSIQLISEIQGLTSSPYVFMLLALGPILGLLALKNNRSLSKS